MILDVRELLQVSINQYYGIEYEEFAAKVAEVGMWLVEHQMNEAVSLEFGQNVINLPLQDSANIQHGNALRVPWEDVVPRDQLNYIIGNPPFIGASYQTKDQKADLDIVCHGMKSYRLLDYVCGWYIKAADFISETDISVAFVSTNSISQGEQVPVLWGHLLEKGIKINFAHRTFQWSNDAKGKAAVHCVIIGMSNIESTQKYLFDYDHVKGEPQMISVQNINPYLIDSTNVIISRRKTSINQVPLLVKGNQPTDGGNFLFKTDDEKEDFVRREPQSEQYIRKYIGARELINGAHRWCLWLNGVNPSDLRRMPLVLERVNKVKEMRLQSSKKSTRNKAATPTLFDEIRHTDEPYLAIPEVSSERRVYMPVAYLDKDVISSNKVYMLTSANRFNFGCLHSIMHMIWFRNVAGRLKSDFTYSSGIVYNNFPWPKDPTDKQKEKVETCAQAVLDTRERYPDSSLADLYDPLTMPPDLVKAHQQLDRAVDRCYRPQPFTSERNRIEYLFELYEQYTAPLLAAESKKGKKSRKKKG
jgi:hypothetical protein